MPEGTSTTGSDPLKAIADAMESAVHAAREGASDAQAMAAEAVPAAGKMLSRAVYSTCYTISYGVVFSSVFIARSIPKNNAVVHGLIDGAHAAIDMVREMKSGASGGPGEPAAAPEPPGGDAQAVQS